MLSAIALRACIRAGGACVSDAAERKAVKRDIGRENGEFLQKADTQNETICLMLPSCKAIRCNVGDVSALRRGARLQS